MPLPRNPKVNSITEGSSLFFDAEDLLALHDGLDRFAALDPEKAEFVKLRYFVGLSLEETASALGVSLTTAKRWWQYARACPNPRIRQVKPRTARMNADGDGPFVEVGDDNGYRRSVSNGPIAGNSLSIRAIRAIRGFPNRACTVTRGFGSWLKVEMRRN